MAEQVVFEDEHIAIRLVDFTPHTGAALVAVDEKHQRVGYYYIWVNFESSDSTRFDYDGGNPNRVQTLEARTTHRNDKIKEIVAKRVRD